MLAEDTVWFHQKGRIHGTEVVEAPVPLRHDEAIVKLSRAEDGEVVGRAALPSQLEA